MPNHDTQRNPIDVLADEFLGRIRQGQHPSLSEYANQHPELADEIRELFLLLLEMEDARPGSESGNSSDGEGNGALPSMKELGDYRIIREVGRGGMGIVYEAEQISLGRRVALKVLPEQMLLNATHQQRFEREARAAGKLHHTNIVPVFGVGEADGYHFYVMQFIAGMGLDDVIREIRRMNDAGSSGSSAPAEGSLRVVQRGDISAGDVSHSLMTGKFRQTSVADSSEQATDVDGPPHENASCASNGFTVTASSSIPRGDSGHTSGRGNNAYWHSVARIGRQVADALDYAHRQGILRRDIKPGNLLLDLRGTVWVTDFDLAKASDQHDLTHTGDILGTLRYVPPEAFEGTADARGDVYSLGLTLYEMLAMRPAFGETDRHKLIREVTTSAPPRLDKVNSKIPRNLVTIVHKAIDRDCAHRYQNAAEFQEDLERFLHDEPIRARRTSPIERLTRWARRNYGLAASLGSIAALLVIGLVVSVVAAGHFRELAKEKSTIAGENSRLAADMTTLAERSSEAVERAASAEQREADLRTVSEADAEARRQEVYFSDMFLGGHAASEQFSFFMTSRILDEWKPQLNQKDLRGWEWYYLNGRQHMEARTFHFREQRRGWVFDLDWSPDGKQILAAGYDRTTSDGRRHRPLVVWNVESGQVTTQILDQELERANVAAYSPDGEFFAAGFHRDNFVRIYETSTGRLAHSLATVEVNVLGLQWTPDGRQLVTNGQGGQPIQVWDPYQEQEVLRLPESAAFLISPLGAEIATVHPNRVDLHSLLSGAMLRTLHESPVGFAQPGTACAWSPDAKTLAVASSRNSVFLIDAQSGEMRGECIGHAAAINTIDWSPDSARLLTSGGDSVLRVWDAATAESLAAIGGHGSVTWGGRWSPDGRQIASGSWDGTVRLWDVEKVLRPTVIQASSQQIRCVRFNPTRHQVASSGDDGIVRTWRPGAFEPAHELVGHAGGVPAIAYSPDGKRLASAGADGTVRLWRASDGAAKAVLRAEGRLNAVDWDEEGRRIAAITHEGLIKVWDADSGDELLAVRHAVNPDPYLAWDWKAQLFFGGRWQPPQIMDPHTGSLIHTDLSELGPTTAVRLNPDRSLFGVCHEGPLAIVYYVAPTVEEVVSLTGHPVGSTTICFNPDGARIATGGANGEVYVWDTTTGLPTLTIQAHAATVRPIDWSPDSMRIVSAADDGTLAIHDASPGFIREHSPRALPELDRIITEQEHPIRELRIRAEIRRQLGEDDKANDDLQQVKELLSQQPDESSDSQRKSQLEEQCAAYLAEPDVSSSAAAAAEDGRPNIVMILIDDLGYGDLGCYGSTVNETPNIDRLAERGLRCTDFHSNGPMCSATRAALLTGCYQQRFGREFDGALSPRSNRELGLPLEAVTLAEVLRDAGYATGMFGKWHLGYKPPLLPASQGFDEFRGLVSGDGDHHTHIDRSGLRDWWHNDEIRMEAGYTADLLTDYSIDFMERHAGRPFFLYLAHLSIHFPWQGPDDPPHRVEGTNYADDKWGIIPDRSNVAPHVKAMIASVDESVGRVMAALERLNLEHNTLVVFASDNGGYLNYASGGFENISSNGSLKGQKGSVHEGGHRVPGIFCWPRHIEAGRETDETVMSMDLFPTCAALAGAPLPNGQKTDGADLAPLLFEQQPLSERMLFWRSGDDRAVREGPWKLNLSDLDQPHLFNLDNDLGESVNSADDHPELVRRLTAAYALWEADVNSGFATN